MAEVKSAGERLFDSVSNFDTTNLSNLLSADDNPFNLNKPAWEEFTQTLDKIGPEGLYEFFYDSTTEVEPISKTSKIETSDGSYDFNQGVLDFFIRAFDDMGIEMKESQKNQNKILLFKRHASKQSKGSWNNSLKAAINNIFSIAGINKRIKLPGMADIPNNDGSKSSIITPPIDPIDNSDDGSSNNEETTMLDYVDGLFSSLLNKTKSAIQGIKKDYVSKDDLTKNEGVMGAIKKLKGGSGIIDNDAIAKGVVEFLSDEFKKSLTDSTIKQTMIDTQKRAFNTHVDNKVNEAEEKMDNSFTQKLNRYDKDGVLKSIEEKGSNALSDLEKERKSITTSINNSKNAAVKSVNTAGTKLIKTINTKKIELEKLLESYKNKDPDSTGSTVDLDAINNAIKSLEDKKDEVGAYLIKIDKLFDAKKKQIEDYIKGDEFKNKISADKQYIKVVQDIQTINEELEKIKMAGGSLTEEDIKKLLNKTSLDDYLTEDDFERLLLTELQKEGSITKETEQTIKYQLLLEMLPVGLIGSEFEALREKINEISSDYLTSTDKEELNNKLSELKEYFIEDGFIRLLKNEIYFPDGVLNKKFEEIRTELGHYLSESEINELIEPLKSRINETADNFQALKERYDTLEGTLTGTTTNADLKDKLSITIKEMAGVELINKMLKDYQRLIESLAIDGIVDYDSEGPISNFKAKLKEIDDKINTEFGKYLTAESIELLFKSQSNEVSAFLNKIEDELNKRLDEEAFKGLLEDHVYKPDGILTKLLGPLKEKIGKIGLNLTGFQVSSAMTTEKLDKKLGWAGFEELLTDHLNQNKDGILYQEIHKLIEATNELKTSLGSFYTKDEINESFKDIAQKTQKWIKNESERVESELTIYVDDKYGQLEGEHSVLRIEHDELKDRYDHLEQLLKDGEIIKHNNKTNKLESNAEELIIKTIEEQVNDPLSTISKTISERVVYNLEHAGQALNNALIGLGYAKQVDLNATNVEVTKIQTDLTALNNGFITYKKSARKLVEDLQTKVTTIEDYHTALNDHINSKLPEIEAKIDAQIGDNATARTALKNGITTLLNTNYDTKAQIDEQLKELKLDLNEDDREHVAVIMQLIGQLKTEVAGVTAEIGKYKAEIIKQYGSVMEGYNYFAQIIGNMQTQAQASRQGQNAAARAQNPNLQPSQTAATASAGT